MVIPRGISALFGSLGVAVCAAAQPIPGTDLEVTGLVAELPWTFEVKVESPEGQEEGAKSVTRFRFKSTEPYSSSEEGKTYLRLELKTSEFDSSEAADGAFEQLLADAHPAIGLSYAWDQVFLSGETVYHLKVPCLFSEANFRRIVSSLEAALQQRGPPTRVLGCRCGNGCEEEEAGR